LRKKRDIVRMSKERKNSDKILKIQKLKLKTVRENIEEMEISFKN